MATKSEIVKAWFVRVWHSVIAWWFHARSQTAHVVMPGSAPINRNIPPPHLALTAADRLDWVCRLYGGTYKILRLGDGVVVLFIKGHDVTASGLASNTAKAVGLLVDRLERENS